MWPTPRAEYSSAASSVVAVRRRAVSGRPSSLLNEPSGNSVSPNPLSTWPSRSLVEVLPLLPVIPNVSGWAWP